MRDTIRLAHNVEIQVRSSRTGRLLRRLRTHNKIVTTGLQQLIDLAIGANQATFSYGAVGTNGTAADAAQTALLGEVFREALTANTRNGVVWTVTLYLAATQANGNTLQEFGEFTDNVSGLMLGRIVHTPIAKTVSITITYLHTITLAGT
jgi:hypothetical protein